MELNFDSYKDFKIKAILEEQTPIIENFLNQKEFMLLHATAKTGKSMFALNLALAVATGRDFLCMQTFKSKVLYLQTEIANYSLKDRIETMLSESEIEDYNNAGLNLFISNDRIRLDEQEGINLLLTKIISHKPSLIIIDPLYELHRKNEDSASDMSPILSNIRDIGRKSNCAIILVHHQGKKSESQFTNGNPGHMCRGSSSFGDVPDISISLSKDQNGINLKGIFRNREGIENLRLKNLNQCLKFELENFVPKPKKTSQLVLEALLNQPNGLTKNDIYKIIKQHTSVSSDAVRKHLEIFVQNGKVHTFGDFRNTKFLLNAESGGN